MYITGKEVEITGEGLDILQADSFSANIEVQTAEHKPLGEDPFELPTGVKVTGSISGAMLDKGVSSVLGLNIEDPMSFAKDLNGIPDLTITAKFKNQNITFSHVMIKKVAFSASGNENVKVDIDFTANPKSLSEALAGA